MAGRVLRLDLQIDLRGTETPCGRVAVAGAPAHRFSGWLGLMAAIRAAWEHAAHDMDANEGGNDDHGN